MAESEGPGAGVAKQYHRWYPGTPTSTHERLAWGCLKAASPVQNHWYGSMGMREAFFHTSEKEGEAPLQLITVIASSKDNQQWN